MMLGISSCLVGDGKGIPDRKKDDPKAQRRGDLDVNRWRAAKRGQGVFTSIGNRRERVS